MKITSIKNKLNKLGIKTTINVSPMTNRDTHVIRGYSVKLIATNGHDDVEVSAHVMNDEIDFNDIIVESQIADRAIAVATTDNIAVKRSNDESDSMTDYCAYTFFRSVKSLEYVFGKVVA